MDKDELINELRKLPYGTKLFVGESITNGQVQVKELSSVGTALSADEDSNEVYYGIIYLKPIL
jgi:hypothetical protein